MAFTLCVVRPGVHLVERDEAAPGEVEVVEERLAVQGHARGQVRRQRLDEVLLGA